MFYLNVFWGEQERENTGRKRGKNLCRIAIYIYIFTYIYTQYNYNFLSVSLHRKRDASAHGLEAQPRRTQA